MTTKKTLKVQELLEAQLGLGEINKLDLLGKESLMVLRLIKAINNELEPVNAARKKVAERFAETNKQGQAIIDLQSNFKIAKEHRPSFMAEIKEIGEQEIEMAFTPIPFSWLEDRPVSGETLGLADPFIDFDEPQPKQSEQKG